MLWYKKKEKKICYSFDIEIHKHHEFSNERTNIPSAEAKRQIVIPEEYESLMNRVFNEPAVKEIVEREKWKVITFENLTVYYNKVKNATKIDDLHNFEKLARTPREQIKKQANLMEFGSAET